MSSTSIGPGSRVLLLIECRGETEGQEITVPPGALGVVDAIDLFSNEQGLAVTVLLDAGIVNVFDHEDGPLSSFLQLVGQARVAA